MKVNIFKKLIRDIIREELDYKFSRLEKKLDEVVVKGNSNNINEARTQVPQTTDFKKLMNGENKVQSNMSAPKTNSNVLNSLLQETAESANGKRLNEMVLRSSQFKIMLINCQTICKCFNERLLTGN